MNQTYLTEMSNSNSENLHHFSTLEIIQTMNEEDKTVPYVVEKALPQIRDAIDIVVEYLRKGGRLFYIGAGTSGRLGVLDASECPPTFGVPHGLVNGIIAGGDSALRYPIENAEDDKESGEKIIEELVSKHDVVVGIASSGRTPFVLGAIERANELGIPTIGISCNLDSELAKTSRYPIEIPVGPEIITGSTRLKAGTAQKLVLNMISTTTMIKLGKVYKNLMVNVQATNEKLRKRTISIIQELTGVNEEIAKDMNDKAKGDARIAVLMIKFKVEYEFASNILKECDGNFPKAMERLQKHAGQQKSL